MFVSFVLVGGPVGRDRRNTNNNLHAWVSASFFPVMGVATSACYIRCFSFTCYVYIRTFVCRLLGSASIIILAFLRRRVFSAEVHPIFMLSFADCILDVMWIVGSGLWWAVRDESNLACFTMTILTEVRAKTKQEGRGRHTQRGREGKGERERERKRERERERRREREGERECYATPPGTWCLKDFTDRFVLSVKTYVSASQCISLKKLAFNWLIYATVQGSMSKRKKHLDCMHCCIQTSLIPRPMYNFP